LIPGLLGKFEGDSAKGMETSPTKGDSEHPLNRNAFWGIYNNTALPKTRKKEERKKITFVRATAYPPLENSAADLSSANPRNTSSTTLPPSFRISLDIRQVIWRLSLHGHRIVHAMRPGSAF
jgi:hypothetical protein